MRKSYGMAMGNVYGSCFFNVFILTISESFMPQGTTLLSAMAPSHFVAGAGALGLMTFGYLAMKSAETPSMSVAKILTPTVPIIYVVLMYIIYSMG